MQLYFNYNRNEKSWGFVVVLGVTKKTQYWHETKAAPQLFQKHLALQKVISTIIT